MKRATLPLALFALGSPAYAADLAMPWPAPPSATYHNWSGFYLGGNLGGAFGTSSFSDTAIPQSSFSSNGISSFVGGGQLGVNYEFGSGVVVGAEAMFDWLSNTPTKFAASNPRAGIGTGTINSRSIAAVTGKLGYAWDRLLVYGKGGGAWVETDNSFNVGATPAGVSVNSGSQGWTIGAGLEWALAPQWSIRAEYDLVGLQPQAFTVSAIPPTPFARDQINVSDRNIQMLSAGFNYKIGIW
jgi:outer membrane immunogenic protein